jgi:hypothetical protein
MTFLEFLRGQAQADAGVLKLLEEMASLQGRTATRIGTILADLDIRDGNLVATESNIAKLSQVMADIESDFVDPQWRDAVKEYVKTFDVLDANTTEWVGQIGSIDKGLMKALRTQYKQISAEYLLNAQSFSQTLLNPIAQEVGAYIATGSRYSDLVSAVTQIVTGGDTSDGAILGNARTTVNDLVSVYERTATNVASEQVGAVFFLYQGRPIKTTRPFCRERANNYYHKQEIASWASEDWQGKTEGTNSTTIFSYLGGYNCRHVLVPVRQSEVAAQDLQRMRDKGLIT